MNGRYQRAVAVYRATSGDAWASVLEHLAAVDATILRAIGRRGATSDAVELATGLKHQTVSAQIRHLTEAGLLVASEDRQPTRSGRAATVWTLAPRPAPVPEPVPEYIAVGRLF